MYYIQCINSTCINREWTVDDEGEALECARLASLERTREYNLVRVITIDGELVTEYHC